MEKEGAGRGCKFEDYACIRKKAKETEADSQGSGGVGFEVEDVERRFGQIVPDVLR